MVDEEQEKNSLSAQGLYGHSLLGSAPQTDPEHLRTMENQRLSRAHYSAIGRVAAMWAELEVLTDYFSIEIAELDESYAACFTSHIPGIANKFEAYIAITTLRTGEKFSKKMNILAETANLLARRRNRIIHDPWIFDDAGSPKRYEISARKILTQKVVPVTTVQVHELSNEIEALTDAVVSLSKEILANVKALERKQKSKTFLQSRSIRQKDKISQLRNPRRRTFPR